MDLLHYNDFLGVSLERWRKKDPEVFLKLDKMMKEIKKEIPEASVILENSEFATIGDVYRLSRKINKNKENDLRAKEIMKILNEAIGMNATDEICVCSGKGKK